MGESGISRLDVAKMAVEDISRQMKKRHGEHARILTQELDMHCQRSIVNLGQKGNVMGLDRLLLLSTSRQYPEASSCAAGGRLLVGFGSNFSVVEDSAVNSVQDPADPFHQQSVEAFQRELKGLRTTRWSAEDKTPFPEGAGGAAGLNAALSAGLQLLSRYRLEDRRTENFGMGRLPNSAVVVGSHGAPTVSALQPACLILVTDGACLRQHPKLGGGGLQLQFGSQPLREFYKEPFRWDQRLFCLGIGGHEEVSSSQYLHPQLRALCEVTGGSHWMVRNAKGLHMVTEELVKRLRPSMPSHLPLALDHKKEETEETKTVPMMTGSCFVNGGPVCAFQPIELDDGQRMAKTFRAVLLYVGAKTSMQAAKENNAPVISPPLWLLPEDYFPSKKLDSLPPRTAQPILHLSKYPTSLGSKSFDPLHLMKMLSRLDEVLTASRTLVGQPVKLLHRDTYICDWLNEEGGKPISVSFSSKTQTYPVFCRGSGRPSLGDDTAESMLNLGVLHAPHKSSSLADDGDSKRLATLTLLPPDPHILIPLLLRAAEVEYRALQKTALAIKGSTALSDNVRQKQILSRTIVALDEKWKAEFRAYLFRVPPYYQLALKRALRLVLPKLAHALLPTDNYEGILYQCLSKVCLQKIRNGEKAQKEYNDKKEKQESNLRCSAEFSLSANPQQPLRYGQFDPRSSVDSYLAALRHLPAPPKPGKNKPDATSPDDANSTQSMFELVGDLPARCMMAYYEARRRWIFGGPGLATRGLHADGVSNGGSNYQRCGRKADKTDECFLTAGNIGVSTLNKKSTTKMGDYRERLLFSRSPVVGYGSNDYGGVAATTAIDGSPVWSVDDDALPAAFFNPKTGEFADSIQSRLKSRLMVNFGNPYREKRADSLVPEQFADQSPSSKRPATKAPGSPGTPPGSPPHDSSFESVEEDEAAFVRISPSHTSPKRDEPDEDIIHQPRKRLRLNPQDTSSTQSSTEKQPKSAPPPPPRPPKLESRTATSLRPPPPPPKPGVQQTKPKPPLQKQETKIPRQSSADSQSETGDTEVWKQASFDSQQEQLDLQRPDKKPSVSLPPNWMCVWSKSQKRWYFFDTRTNKSVWEWPPPS